MKLKEVKTYQSVKFKGGQETFFSKASQKMLDVEMEAVSWGIRIRSKYNDAIEDVIVSFNNVAYAKVEDSEDKKSLKK